MVSDPKRISRRAVLRLGAAGLAAGTGLGMLNSQMEVTDRTLRLPRWRGDGLRVAQVSDVHLINPRMLHDAQEAVEVAVKAKPDVFVFTGDFLNYDDEASLARIQPAFEALEGVSCPCLAILGNHDYLSGVPSKISDQVRKTKLRLLVNETVEVEGCGSPGSTTPTNRGRTMAWRGTPTSCFCTSQTSLRRCRRPVWC